MISHATPSDEELLRQMRAGDEEAFVLLYRRWQGGVYRFALRMSGSEAVAEDVTQEVFIVLMKNPARYDAARGSLSTWLFGIARNQVLRHLHHNRPYVALGAEAENEPDEAEGAGWRAGDDPLGDLTRSETIDSVRQAVLALPEHYREVIVLCELHELNYADAAQVIGCPIGTVRSRLNRARGLLAGKLKSTLMIPQAVAEKVVSMRYV